MPDVLRNILRYDYSAIDQILGIQEQVKNIETFSGVTPEDKMYIWLTD